MGKVSEQKKAPKYEPGKSYKWEEHDEFVLKGTDFSALYNTLKEMVERPGGMSINNISVGRVVECQNILHRLFVRGIEAGVVVEIKDKLLEEALEEAN